MDGIRQHTDMAMGEKIEGQGNSFGVEPLHATSEPIEDPDGHDHKHDTHLADHERGAGMPIKHHPDKMHAQANPDHGPHHHEHHKK